MSRNEELVDQLQGETGLSDAAVRSVLYRLRKLGWRVVRPATDDPHHVTFNANGWFIEHSVACRNAGSMLDCDIDRLVRRFASVPPDAGPGRFVAKATEGHLRLTPAPPTPAATALLITEEWTP